MLNKLELYFEDIDSIFEMVKKELGYNYFTVSSKNKFNLILEECLKASKKYIEDIYLDTEEAVKALSAIQINLQRILVGFRIADEIYKDIIYKMSPSYYQDSTLPYGYKQENWKIINQSN